MYSPSGAGGGKGEIDTVFWAPPDTREIAANLECRNQTGLIGDLFLLYVNVVFPDDLFRTSHKSTDNW